MNPADATEWVFAYGSNLHIQDLKHWLRHYGYSDEGILTVLPAVLPNYKLVWNYYSPVRKGGAANVEPASGHQVMGALLEITPATLPGIDKKEGHPARYCRGDKRLNVRVNNQETYYDSWVYEVQAAYQTPEPTQPTQAYLEIMLEGIRQIGLPEAWLKQVLKSLPEPATASMKD